MFKSEEHISHICEMVYTSSTANLESKIMS